MKVMAKTHVSNLTTRALDYAVAIAIGEHVEWLEDFQLYGVRDRDDPIACDPLKSYSSDWAHGGPLISRYRIDTYWHSHYNGQYQKVCEAIFHKECFAFAPANSYDAIGPTMLIATCRAIVASKLGEWVDVPDDLVSDEDDA